MNKFFCFFIPFLIFACGGNAPEGTNNDQSQQEADTITVDTLASVDSLQNTFETSNQEVDVDVLIAKAKKSYDPPVAIDSVFISEYTNSEGEGYNLTGAEVKYLSKYTVENTPTNMTSHFISTFIYLDSIITAGGWDDYESSLDLGMARYSTANAIGRINFGGGNFLLLWTTDYATYEACPYGYGTCVFGTFFMDDAALNTTLLGEISGGGDPPMWGAKLVTSKITQDEITLHSLDQWGEEDYETLEEIVEKDELTCKMTIATTGIRLDEEIKEQ
ncbi:MAG: hypothetical protein HUJ25_17180 [Crocinitomicaceae bacterium]|nr:hypothetical protein [Crocinitomicaceae bacterium]